MECAPSSSMWRSELSNSLTPQLRKSEIFAEVFVCGAKRRHENRAKIEDFWGVVELGNCGVKELESSGLLIYNGKLPRPAPWGMPILDRRRSVRISFWDRVNGKEITITLYLAVPIFQSSDEVLWLSIKSKWSYIEFFCRIYISSKERKIFEFSIRFFCRQPQNVI